MFTLKFGSYLVEISSVKDLDGIDGANALPCFLTQMANVYHDAAEYHFDHGRDALGNKILDDLYDIWNSVTVIK